jgi:hypothetical protein
MTERTAIQCDLSPELFTRFAALRKKFGMGNRGLLERILLEALPRWEAVPEPKPLNIIEKGKQHGTN